MDQSRLERLLSSLHDADNSTSVLHRICIVCADTTSLAGAGVSRITDGHHEMVVASNPAAERIEMLQVTLAEGPCLEVIASFRPAFEPDLASARAVSRWPRFATAATDSGVAAAFAFPLLTDGVAVGALDVYSTRTGDLGNEQIADALMLAELAALAVDQIDATPDIDGVAIHAEPPEPWAHAAVVHNASGMVSEHLGIDVNEALLRLRALAFATERTVADIARDVVARQLRLESWADRD